MNSLYGRVYVRMCDCIVGPMFLGREVIALEIWAVFRDRYSWIKFSMLKDLMLEKN